MNLHEATKALTAYIAEHADKNLSPTTTQHELREVYTGANNVLDRDKRLIPDHVLDELLGLYASAEIAGIAESITARRDPAGSPIHEATVQHAVHDYLDDANLALLRAGYDGERLRADTLEQITKA